MEHPKAIGDRSTLAIMLALQEAGYTLFLPFGENSRCDLAIEIGDRLVRVQCKTGRLREGAVRFKVSSCYAHHRNPRSVTRDYLGEVDYFAVYCPETAGVYLIPIKDIELTCQGALRIDAPRNGQRRRIRFAAPYEIASVAVTATEAPAGSAGGSAPCA
jgi:hypothetical protein